MTSSARGTFGSSATTPATPTGRPQIVHSDLLREPCTSRFVSYLCDGCVRSCRVRTCLRAPHRNPGVAGRQGTDQRRLPRLRWSSSVEAVDHGSRLLVIRGLQQAAFALAAAPTEGNICS